MVGDRNARAARCGRVSSGSVSTYTLVEIEDMDKHTVGIPSAAVCAARARRADSRTVLYIYRYFTGIYHFLISLQSGMVS